MHWDYTLQREAQPWKCDWVDIDVVEEERGGTLDLISHRLSWTQYLG